MTAGSRLVVLGKIRVGLTDIKGDAQTEYMKLPRLYKQRGSKGIDAMLSLMVERLREYDADVVECTDALLTETIAAQIAGSGRRVLTAPSGLPPQWLANGVTWCVDDGLDYEQIEEVEGVITASSCGIAESGTIVLHHTAAEGRRVITLLPDWHLCVLRASQVVETMPEYFARCTRPPVLATYISGPSATADIEMTRIKGVHGPRFLSVILVRDE